MYQVRFGEGGIKEYDTLTDALNHRNGDWEKVSWTTTESDRLILYREGTWELRTPESLLKKVG